LPTSTFIPGSRSSSPSNQSSVSSQFKSDDDVEITGKGRKAEFVSEHSVGVTDPHNTMAIESNHKSSNANRYNPYHEFQLSPLLEPESTILVSRDSSSNRQSPGSLQNEYNLLKHENSQLRNNVAQLFEKVYDLERELERVRSQNFLPPNSSNNPYSTSPSSNRTYIPPHYHNTGEPSISYPGYPPYHPYPYPPFPPHAYSHIPSYPNPPPTHAYFAYHQSHYAYSHPPPSTS
jgi:hypothetical protein